MKFLAISAALAIGNVNAFSVNNINTVSPMEISLRYLTHLVLVGDNGMDGATFFGLDSRIRLIIGLTYQLG